MCPDDHMSSIGLMPAPSHNTAPADRSLKLDDNVMVQGH
jgi:hypothetical protein